jgi:hypothetical protein
VGRNVAEAAETAAVIAREMGGLAEAARIASTGAAQTGSAIADLNETVGRLRSFLALFKV